MEDVFAGQADFAQVIKLYGDHGQFDAAGRYSPASMVETIIKIRDGRPDMRHISTVERQNLTMRMAIRRFTRLTNAFSNKLDNLKAACALHFAYYNLCRIHKSLRVTPAMEAGLNRPRLDDPRIAFNATLGHCRQPQQRRQSCTLGVKSAILGRWLIRGAVGGRGLGR